jgi:hypothetical protein
MAEERDNDTAEHSAVDAEVVEGTADDGPGGAVAAGETTEVSFSRSASAPPEDGADTTADAPVGDAPVTDAPAETVSETAAPYGDAPSTTPPPNVTAPPAFEGPSGGGTSPAAADRAAAAGGDDKFAERPELFVAGAFLGAFVLAKLLGRLAGDDE